MLSLCIFYESMYIGYVNYYDEKNIEFNSESEGKFRRENGNKRWLEFYNYLQKKNSKIEIYDSKNHFNYDLILIREIPRVQNLIKLKINNILKKKIPLILLLEESPLARSRYSLMFGKLYDLILVASNQKNYKFKRYITKNFCYGNIPNKDELTSLDSNFNYPKRDKLLCYISTNLSAINSKSTYKDRFRIVKNLSESYPSKFNLYGKNWDKYTPPMDLPLIAIIYKFLPIIQIILNPFTKKIKSLGQINSKKDVMINYKFCLAIEPYLGEPYCVMEKMFDPMLAGCIPVYLGFNHNITGVPKNTFISIDSNIESAKLISKLEGFSKKELDEIRNNIRNYLPSKKADIYRYKTFAKFVYNSLKEFINKN